MPVEFRCPQCNRLLKVPDDAAGKKARCPECQAITDIPAASTPHSTPAHEPTVPSQPNPYAEKSSPGWGTQPAKDPSGAANPYQSAAPIGMPGRLGPSVSGPAEMVHRKVDFGFVFTHTWETFTKNFGMCLLLGLLMFAIQMGVTIVNYPIDIAGQMALKEGILVGFVASVVVEQVIGIAVGGAVSSIAIAVVLNVVRGSQQPFEGVFSRFGRYVVRLILQQLLMTLIAFAIVIVPTILVVGGGNMRQPGLMYAGIGAFIICIPVMWFVMCMFLIAPFFIVDRDMGVLQSMSASRRFMDGNKLISFALIVVTVILGVFAVFATCCLGLIPAMAYGWLFLSVIYLSATGQFSSYEAPSKPYATV